jgi:hypothetical protein
MYPDLSWDISILNLSYAFLRSLPILLQTSQQIYRCEDRANNDVGQPEHHGKPSSTTRSDSASMLPVIQTCPLGSSTWINPIAVGRLCSPLDRAASPRWIGASVAVPSVTRTGSKLTASVFPEPSNLRWYCLRH